MAASWTVYGHTGNATSSGNTHTLLTNSALAFGGGHRWDAILTAIQVDNANTSLHIGGTTGSDSPDCCPSPHLHVLSKPINTVTGAYVDTTPGASGASGWISDDTGVGGYVTPIDVDSPAAYHGIRFHFNYDNAVEITNAEIWAGTGADVTVVNHDNCQVWMCELYTSKSANSWERPYYGSTIALTEKSSKEANSAHNHNWHIGMSIIASAVGFEADNKFKITCTYQ
jgi:hypothetical protein